jgi:hypothetical protein
MVTCVPTAILGGNRTQVAWFVTGWFAPIAVVPGRLAATRMQTFAQAW